MSYHMIVKNVRLYEPKQSLLLSQDVGEQCWYPKLGPVSRQPRSMVKGAVIAVANAGVQLLASSLV